MISYLHSCMGRGGSHHYVELAHGHHLLPAIAEIRSEAGGDGHPYLSSYVHECNVEGSACLCRLPSPCQRYIRKGTYERVHRQVHEGGGVALHHICSWCMGTTYSTPAQHSGDGRGGHAFHLMRVSIPSPGV